MSPNEPGGEPNLSDAAVDPDTAGDLHIARVQLGPINEPRIVDIRIRRGIITTISKAPLPEDPSCSYIDGTNLFVCPGLIDVHVHLILDAVADVVAYVGDHDRDAYHAVAERNATRTLLAGFTTVRDMGCCSFVVPQLRDEFALAPGVGPRIRACGHMLMAPGGHVLDISRTVDPGSVGTAVQDQLDGGADFIKLIASGGLLTPGTDPKRREMGAELIREVGLAARRVQRDLAVHAYDDAVVIEAIGAGARTIEHGSWLTSPILERMAAADVFLVPTLKAPRALLDHADELPPHVVANAQAATDAAHDLVVRARAAGTAIAVGTDAGTPFNCHGENATELELMVDCGMSAAEAVDSATTVGARLLGLDGAIGTISVGAAGDLLLLGADPRQDLQALGDVRSVVAAGRLAHIPA